MKIIISPAKKMNVDTDSLPWLSQPEFMSKTQILHTTLKQMNYDDLKKLWKCNDQIATLNYDRIHSMDLCSNLTPAILAYEGIQYQYMAPGVFTQNEFDYIQKHLRILSGFYGFLKPFDGIIPYRLEMQAKLSVDGHRDLYSFWGNTIAQKLSTGENCILNLASKEYSVCVSKHIDKSVKIINCIFGEEKNGKIIEKGTMCKMARGEMVRYMAENHITSHYDIKHFERLNYKFSPDFSDENNYVFILSKEAL